MLSRKPLRTALSIRRRWLIQTALALSLVACSDDSDARDENKQAAQPGDGGALPEAGALDAGAQDAMTTGVADAARDGASADAAPVDASTEAGNVADANQVMLSGACMGTFTLKAPANVATIEGCTSISGDLVVGGSGAYDSVPTTLTSVRLPLLASIGGALQIPDNNPLLKTLELPELVSVGKDVRISKTPLVTLSLPKLTTVGWRLSIVDNAELTSLQLPALNHVEQHFDVARHPRLTTFEVPNFTSIGGSIFFSSNTVLTSIAAPKLKQVGDLLNIRNNWVLSSLQLPALTTVGGDFLIVENSQLPVCQAQAVLSRLVGFMGMVDLHNNSATGTCN